MNEKRQTNICHGLDLKPQQHPSWQPPPLCPREPTNLSCQIWWEVRVRSFSASSMEAPPYLSRTQTTCHKVSLRTSIVVPRVSLYGAETTTQKTIRTLFETNAKTISNIYNNPATQPCKEGTCAHVQTHIYIASFPNRSEAPGYQKANRWKQHLSGRHRLPIPTQSLTLWMTDDDDSAGYYSLPLLSRCALTPVAKRLSGLFLHYDSLLI